MVRHDLCSDCGFFRAGDAEFRRGMQQQPINGHGMSRCIDRDHSTQTGLFYYTYGAVEGADCISGGTLMNQHLPG